MKSPAERIAAQERTVRSLEAQLASMTLELAARKAEIVNLNEEALRRSIELAAMGNLGSDQMCDLQAEIEAYKVENKELVAFAQTVAESQSKFARGAKNLLGQ